MSTALTNTSHYVHIPATFDETMRLAKIIHQSNIGPRGYNAEAIFVCIQYGATLGLTPMQSLQMVYVVYGKAGLYAYAQKAIIMASGQLESYSEKLSGEGVDMMVEVTVKRVGRNEYTESFSIQDAIDANLRPLVFAANADSNWKKYPKRMLKARAWSNALRDQFPDLLQGMVYSVEELKTGAIDEENELMDITPEDHVISQADIEEAKTKLKGEEQSYAIHYIDDPEAEKFTGAALQEYILNWMAMITNHDEFSAFQAWYEKNKTTLNLFAKLERDLIAPVKESMTQLRATYGKD